MSSSSPPPASPPPVRPTHSGKRYPPAQKTTPAAAAAAAAAHTRPAKRPRNKFIDEEALAADSSEEDSENEYSEGDFSEGDRAEALEAAAAERELHRTRLRQQEEDFNPEREEARYKSLYGRKEDHYADKGRIVPAQFLLPSITDPGVWAIRCKQGREKDILNRVLKRFAQLHDTANALKLTSITMRDNIKGYLWCEANALGEITDAFDRIPHVYLSNAMLVDVKERQDILKVNKRTMDLRPMSWVRLTRGKYKGDLAQLLEVPELGYDTAKVKLVPRLDYKNNQNKEEVIKNAKGKALKTRPAAKLFTPNDVPKTDRSLSKNGQYWVWNGEHFKDGFLEKDMRITTFSVENVNPTLEEIGKFAGSENSGEIVDVAALTQLTQAAAMSSKLQSAAFLPDEVVDVAEGEFMGAEATIKSIHGDIATVVLRGLGIDDPFDLNISELRKHFGVGETVYVVNGRYKGQSGMVVRVTDNTVNIFNSVVGEEIEVFKKDIKQASSDIASNNEKNHPYEALMLVKQDLDRVGIVLKVDLGILTLLDQDNISRQVRPQDLQGAVDNSKSPAVIDVNNYTVGRLDMVQIVSGLGTGRQGKVLHIHGSFVFVHSSDVFENGGVIVTKPSCIAIIGGVSQGNYGEPGHATTSNPVNSMPALTAGMSGSGAAPAVKARSGAKDQLLHKQVKISRGPYKGYEGSVRDTTVTSLRIQLQANGRIVMIHRDHVFAPAAANGASRGASFGGSTPTWGNSGATPAWRTPGWNGGATPHHGGRIPGHGGITPGHDGGRTPAWDPGAKTPARTPGWGAGGQTPAWDSGSKTPAVGGRTPAWNAGAATPGHGAKTPSWAEHTGAKTPNWGEHTGAGTPNWGETAAAKTPAWGDAAGAKTPSWGEQAPSVATNGGEGPRVPTGGDFNAILRTDDAEAEKDWRLVNVMVKVLSTYNDGEYADQIGYITKEPTHASMTSIQLIDSSSPVDIPSMYLEVQRPEKKDRCCILMGEFRGHIGNVFGIDGVEVIVRTEGTKDYKMMKMNELGKIFLGGS